MFISPVYVYLLLLLILAICFPKNKILLYICITMMLLLGILRDITVGTDTFGYYSDYRTLHGFGDVYKIYHDFEPGFIALIVWFKKYITPDYLPFVSLIFIPFFAGCLRLISYKKVSFPLALFFLFTWGFYFVAYNIMRQMMALGIIFLFIPWLYERKYVKFAIAVLVTALLFHRSSAILLSLIPIHYWVTVKDKFPAKTWLYAAVWISFVIFFVGKTFMQGLLSPIVTLVDPTSLNYIMGNENIELGFTYNSGQSLAASLLIFLYRKGKMNFEMFLFILGISVYNIMGMLSMFGSRLAVYFTLFGIIIFPHILSYRNLNKKEHICLFVFFLYTAIRFAYAYYINNNGEVNPYLFR